MVRIVKNQLFFIHHQLRGKDALKTIFPCLAVDDAKRFKIINSKQDLKCNFHALHAINCFAVVAYAVMQFQKTIDNCKPLMFAIKS